VTTPPTPNQALIPGPVQLSLLPIQHLNVLCYGMSGTGKTEFAATFPKPVLFIDTDNGVTTLKTSPRLKDKDKMQIVRVVDSAADSRIRRPIGALTVTTVLNYLRDEGEYDGVKPATVVVDSLTTTAEYILTDVLYRNNHAGQQPTIVDWGSQMRDVKNLITTGIGLPLNFVCIAHSQFMKDELTGRTWCLPLITGKLAHSLSLYFDEVYFAEAKKVGTNHVYTLLTKSTPLIQAKSRLDLPTNIETNYTSIEKAVGPLLKKGGAATTGKIVQTVNL